MASRRQRQRCIRESNSAVPEDARKTTRRRNKKAIDRCKRYELGKLPVQDVFTFLYINTADLESTTAGSSASSVTGQAGGPAVEGMPNQTVPYTHLLALETPEHMVCPLLPAYQ